MTQETMKHRVAKAICEDGRFPDVSWRMFIPHTNSALKALTEPTEAMYFGLARSLVMWMDVNQSPTPRALFKYLGSETPQWLRDEPEMKCLDHVPSKATRAVLIYKAMLFDAMKERGL